MTITCVFLSVVINSKSILSINSLTVISWADIHDYGLFQSEIVLYFLNCLLLSQNIQIVYIFLDMLATCPWSCMCCTPQLQDDWQPITATSEMLIGLLGHLHMLEVTLNLIDSSRGQRSAWHLWGSSFAHEDATEDPPFCTRISSEDPPFWHVTHKIPQFDWLLLAEVVPIKGYPFMKLTLYKCGTHTCATSFWA